MAHSGVNSLSRILQEQKFYTFCVIRQVRDAAPGQSEKKRGQSSESTGANQWRAFRAPTSNFQIRGENSYHSEPRNPSNEKNTLIKTSGKKEKTRNSEILKIDDSKRDCLFQYREMSRSELYILYGKPESALRLINSLKYVFFMYYVYWEGRYAAFHQRSFKP